MFAALSHLIVTMVMYWTRFDSVYVDIPIVNAKIVDESLFDDYDVQYKSMIGWAAFFQIINILNIFILHPPLSLTGVLMMAADIVGACGCIWQIMDGLVWYNYKWTFGFCVMLPTSINFMLQLQVVVKMEREVYGGFWGGVKMFSSYVYESIRSALSPGWG